MRLETLTACVSLGLAVAAAPDAAWAQGESQEAAARRSLVEQAQQAGAAGDHARALDLAERAGRISMSPSLRMFIAQEQAALGQTAAAFGSADLCVRDADRDTNVRNRDAILATCRELAASLRDRVGRVTVRVPSPAPPGIRVTVSGNTLNDAFFGVPYLVTPGVVMVEATAAGHQPFRTQVTVAANSVVDVPITLERSPEAPVAIPTPGTAGQDGTAARGTGATNLQGTAQESGSGSANTTIGVTGPVIVRPPQPAGPSVLPWVFTGVGVATLGASIVFFALRQGALATLDARCDTATPRNCFPDAQMNLEPVVTFNALTNVTLIAGAAITAGGALWLILTRVGASRPAERTTAFDIAPTVGGAFLSVRGSL